MHLPHGSSTVLSELDMHLLEIELCQYVVSAWSSTIWGFRRCQAQYCTGREYQGIKQQINPPRCFTIIHLDAANRPLRSISASWYRPMACTTSGSTLIRCSTAGRSSHMHRSSPSCFFCCCTIHLELSTCWHSTLRKHSHFQTPLENPSVQSHLVLLCFHERLCIFGPMGTIEMHYYYYYNFSSVLSNTCTHA